MTFRTWHHFFFMVLICVCSGAMSSCSDDDDDNEPASTQNGNGSNSTDQNGNNTNDGSASNHQSLITSNIWKLQSVKVDVSYNYDVDDVAIVLDTNYTLNASDDCRLFISYDFQSDGALEIIFNEGFCGNVKDYSNGNWSLNSNGDLLTLSNPNVGNAAVGEGATITNTSSEVVTRVVRIDASQMVL